MNEIVEKFSEKKSENDAESTLDEEISENNFSKEDYLNDRLEQLLKLETTASQKSFETKLGDIEKEPKGQHLSMDEIEKKAKELAEERRKIELLLKDEITDSQLQSNGNYLEGNNSLPQNDEVYLKKEEEPMKTDEDESDSEERLAEKSNSEGFQTILIDNIETRPTHEFAALARTISTIVKNSTPHFTIGIYGEWGTGKTTLMKAIEKKLVGDEEFQKEQKILPIWFNAWKYEHEDNLATFFLLRTIAYAMENHEKFYPVSQLIFKGLTLFGKNLAQELSMSIISKQGETDSSLDEKMKCVHRLYKDSVYFDGLERIKNEMKRIRESDPDKEYRVVIFIDDLDRCSPSKALEVLESMKLFLDIEGFVFIMGLNYKTVTTLISHAYQTTGVQGEDYIKKIIQIPIKIPTWSHENMIDLIETKIVPNLNEEYTMFLRKNSAMIAKVVEYNPRQLKRFLNNVIIAFETFANKRDSPQITFNEIFLVKILRSEWPDFYKEFVHNIEFRELIEWMTLKPRQMSKYFKYLKNPTDEEAIERREKRLIFLNKLQDITQGKIGPQQIELLADFDLVSWEFFNNVKQIIHEIKDWNLVDSVMDVVEEFPIKLNIGNKQSS